MNNEPVRPQPPLEQPDHPQAPLPPETIVSPGTPAQPPVVPIVDTTVQPSVEPTQINKSQVESNLLPDDEAGLKELIGHDEPAEISWRGPEFVAHDKSISWYGMLVAVALLVAVLVFFVTRDVLSTIVVIICGGIFGVYAGRKPRDLNYTVDNSGITIGSKHYAYEQFRSFSLFEEGALDSVVFMPLKRFSPPLAIYIEPDKQTAVANVIAEYLPVDAHSLDAVDRLLRRIHF